MRAPRSILANTLIPQKGTKSRLRFPQNASHHHIPPFCRRASTWDVVVRRFLGRMWWGDDRSSRVATDVTASSVEWWVWTSLSRGCQRGMSYGRWACWIT